MNLAELIASLPDTHVIGPLDIPIADISYDSRKVAPSSLFVAIKGTHVDGHRFIGQALEHGATAIVYEDEQALEPLKPLRATLVRVPNSRAALSPIAAAFFGYPARQLGVVGVTGSKGKTTTSTLIAHILDQQGHCSGMMTTSDFKLGPRWWSNTTRQTTLEALELQRMLRQIVDAGCDYAVVEASSHGLSARWNRVGDCAFDVAVITNLTHEHLDYHGTWEQYRNDKARLFELLHAETSKGSKTAVINRDDPSADYFIRAAGDADILSYALYHPTATVRPIHIDLSRNGVQYTAVTPQGEIEIELGIPGKFNVYNSLAALCVGLSQGISLHACAAALRSVEGVSGKMERVEQGQPFTVIIDYAHNPDSFEQVMGMMRPLTEGKLISVFGSAGERDRAKRAEQGKIAGRYCDLVVLTDEDPRDEAREAIIEEIAAGLGQADKQEGRDYLKVPDRSQAIRVALAQAAPGDIVLLLGKGHESCIIYERGRTLPWSERAEAEQALRELGFDKASS